jgi:hypothetical protein
LKISDNIKRTGAFQDINAIIETLDFEYVTLKLPDYIVCIEKVIKTDPQNRYNRYKTSG